MQVFINILVILINNVQHNLTDTMKDSKNSQSKISKYFKGSPKSQNTVSTGKLVNQVGSFQINPPCILHISEIVSHFCENCEYKPLCGLCLQEGGHKNHVVKNVEKTSKIVHRVLTEALIRIRAKVNLLQVLGEHIQSRQNQIRSELKDFILNINENFDSIENCLQQKKKKVVEAVQSFYRIECSKLDEAQRSAQQQTNKLNEMINILSQKAEKLDQSSLCIFYYEKKDILLGTLEQGNSIYQDIKKLVPELTWSLDPTLFQQLKIQIDSINVVCGDDYVQLKSDSLMVNKKKNVGKQKQKSFCKDDKSQKLSNFNNSGFWTPKHIDSSKLHKRFTKDMKDSKKLLTLISSDSAQKINAKNNELSCIGLKKGKNKVKFQKNN